MDFTGLVALEDLNGSAFVIANVGEVEEDSAQLYTWVPRLPAAGVTFPIRTCLDNALAAENDNVVAQIKEYLRQVYWLNYIRLHEEVDKYRGQHQAAAAVAYLRMLAVREGLANPETVPAENHCVYNLCRYDDRIPELMFGEVAWYEAVMAEAQRAVGNDGVVTAVAFRAQYTGGLGTGQNNVRPIRYRPKPALPAGALKLLREQFTDMVCLVAFMFRTRGHHWTTDMDGTYRKLWRGCVRSEGRETLLCDWESCSRHVLKSVYPSDLDEYWRHSIRMSKCSAKLAIRWDAPCAGTASIVALRRGYDDLVAAFPVLSEKMAAGVEALEEQEDKVRQHRWATSVNARYYGVPQTRIDERALAPLAACVMAALEQFCEDAPLAKSKALERLANSAPLSLIFRFSALYKFDFI